MSSPEQVIDAFYAALFRGDSAAAKALLAEGALWHALSPFHHWEGEHPMTTYVDEIAPYAGQVLPGYTMESVERDVFDGILVSRLRSSWEDAAAPGGRKHAAGVMIFRIADEKITDLWVINTEGRDASAGF